MKPFLKSLPHLAAFLLLAAIASPAGAQTSVREGHSVLIDLGTEAAVVAALGVSNIPTGCGETGNDPCFTIARLFPVATYIEITATMDGCRNGNATRQVVVNNVTYVHEDDDYFPGFNCANPKTND